MKIHWKGCLLGGAAGGLFGGPIGALVGSFLGSYAEEELSRGYGSAARRAGQVCGRIRSAHERSLAYCTSAGAILGKIAKADGVVTRAEIDAVEAAFVKLGFSPEARARAIAAFRTAKDDARSVGDYARDFVRAVPYVEAREVFYDLLWRIAAADGFVSSTERDMLRRLTFALKINPQWYAYLAAERLRAAGAPGRDELADAYAVLGVTARASDEDVKRAYREKAKKYHPDVLKAQGVPDEMIGQSTELMAKVNAAWAKVRAARGL